ncbi:Hypothetical protein D9617_12g036720 [Elsinoe fawcettii]|nr:Hypothetical protein D9617_12g036720 [Elsinoe fawcettii]
MDLNRIFVGASLPEDHPHAITLPDRRPALITRIMRSPSFGNKIKRQLSRNSLIPSKSLTSLRSHPIRLLHRRSRTRPKEYVNENTAEPASSPEDNYDSDTKSVRITTTRVNTDERQPVVTPINEAARQNISGFEWLVPCIESLSQSVDDPFIYPSPGQAPSSRRGIERSSSAPCLLKGQVGVGISVSEHRKHLTSRIFTMPAAGLTSGTGHLQAIESISDTCRIPTTMIARNGQVISNLGTDKQVMDAFSALLDCSSTQQCFDGNCQKCRTLRQYYGVSTPGDNSPAKVLTVRNPDPDTPASSPTWSPGKHPST